MRVFAEKKTGIVYISAAILAWVGSVSAAYACDCSDPPLQEARARADVVFRGTVVALRPSNGPQGLGDTFDTAKVAVFRVSRVWKGSVGPAFEMPALLETSACWGFSPSLLRAGNDLVVFAFRAQGGTKSTPFFETSVCSRTAPARDNRDIEELGTGYAPATSSSARTAKTYIGSAAVIAGIVALMVYVVRTRFVLR